MIIIKTYKVVYNNRFLKIFHHGTLVLLVEVIHLVASLFVQTIYVYSIFVNLLIFVRMAQNV